MAERSTEESGLRAVILRWEREERWRLLVLVVVVAVVVAPVAAVVVALVVAVVVAGLTGDWRPAAMWEDAEGDGDRGVGTWSEALL